MSEKSLQSKMLSTVFLLATLIAFASADGYTCAGNTLINPFLNLSEPYYYPGTWRENMEPAEYAPDQKCNWKINVPQGTYATVIFYKKTQYESGIKCAYPGKDLEYISDNDQNPYIFTSPQFQVDLKVGDKPGEFSFKVVWSKYPPGSRMNMQLDGIHSLAGVASSFYTTYTAINRVMLVGFSIPDFDSAVLRQSAIYDGDSVNAKYLGNLIDTLHGQIVSTGNKLTIYTFGLENHINNTLFMGLDTAAAGDIQKYNGLNCPADTTRGCSIILQSYFYATAVAKISRQPDYLMLPNAFPYNANVRVYGDKMDINYQTFGNYTQGFEVDILTTKNG
ncbi:CUB-like domain-containing protein [Caenorhabditis elegans]|uniref:CUB-like domain-containing protein n=1 Tax=Caenorhabditis elegans TaxID=6239 RepID=Q21327_CAEEL|nr:CUB-like domain-containing protein [Caenorhabditis elegans]CAA97432.1 CUB-like domain-containing protein [Caenorhabditis elegans]|eukprot:NP_502462.1 Uncharacterized protein CELE_K08D8.5 [Caenorhabditis elegans]